MQQFFPGDRNADHGHHFLSPPLFLFGSLTGPFSRSKRASMKHLLPSALLVLSLFLQLANAQQPAAPATRRGARGGGQQQPIQAKPEELATIKEKTDQIRALVKELKAGGAKPELVDDVEAYAHAGQMLLEYPNMFGSQAAIAHAM